MGAAAAGVKPSVAIKWSAYFIVTMVALVWILATSAVPASATAILLVFLVGFVAVGGQRFLSSTVLLTAAGLVMLLVDTRRASVDTHGFALPVFAAITFVVMLCVRWPAGARKVDLPRTATLAPDGWAGTDENVRESIEERARWLTDQGFERVPGPTRVGDTKLLMERFVHREGRTIASLTPRSGASDVLIEFYSIFENGAGSLSTANVLGFPPSPWVLRQARLRWSASQLWALHLQALQWIAKQDITIDEPFPARFLQQSLDTLVITTDLLVAQPLRRGALMAIGQYGKWRPHTGPLAKQGGINRRLSAIRART